MTRFRWIPVDELFPGEFLLASKGETVRVRGFEDEHVRAQVYNLSVEAVHAYFVVVGDNQVLIHNHCAGSSTQVAPDSNELSN